MYAITGITGKVGSAVARWILAAGQAVRAVVRNVERAGSWVERGCELAPASMEDAASLAAAFEGAEGVFILPPPEFDPAPGFPEACAVIDAVCAAIIKARPEPGWPSDPIDQAFNAALVSWLRFHNAILIGELIPLALRFLRNNPASPHRSAFDHVIVDEYQDLNKAEQMLIDLMAENGSNVVVGDEDQSIYAFRHANPDGIRNFALTHEHTHVGSIQRGV